MDSEPPLQGRLLNKRTADRLRVFALGVKKDYRHTGVAAGLNLEHIKMAAKPDEIHWGEMGWILETNKPMNRAMEGMGGKVVKRYRLFECHLANGA